MAIRIMLSVQLKIFIINELKGTELPSQMVIDLEDSCSDWGDVQFRNELHRLSFRRGPVRHQSTRRKPLRDRINQPQLVT